LPASSELLAHWHGAPGRLHSLDCQSAQFFIGIHSFTSLNILIGFLRLRMFQMKRDESLTDGAGDRQLQQLAGFDSNSGENLKPCPQERRPGAVGWHWHFEELHDFLARHLPDFACLGIIAHLFAESGIHPAYLLQPSLSNFARSWRY